MSSNSRLLRKLRKVMGMAVVSSGLVACFSGVRATVCCKCVKAEIGEDGKLHTVVSKHKDCKCPCHTKMGGNT